MASALLHDITENRNDFKSLDQELNKLLKTSVISNIKTNRNDNQVGSVEFLIRKSILIHFTIPEQYPSGETFVNVSFTVDTSNLKESRAEAVQNFLASANEKLQNLIEKDEFCVIKTFDNIQALISSESSDFSQALDILEHQKNNPPSSNNVVKCKTNNKKEATKAELPKKDKFKGADILFQRFKWDENIDKSQIIIGYLDRFKGIQEIKFLDFKGVHDDRDGIPLHRIRYYKINETIVWDREQRIDILSKSGDISHFFKERVVENVDTPVEVKNEIISEAFAYSFNAGQWSVLDSELGTNNEFFSGLKIISYNIMSSNNFSKGINDTIKRAKHSGGLDCGLDKVDRISKILESFKASNSDLICLQECEGIEERLIKNNEFIQKNYYVISSHNESYCVILSKMKPKWVRSVKLCHNSNKNALCAKFALKTTSMSSFKELVVSNIHLTSGKANDYLNKRASQMKALKSLHTDDPEFTTDYSIIAGDFNFGEEEECFTENSMIKNLFIDNGFQDLIPHLNTFDPTENYTATITSHKYYARRLDRILLKASDPLTCYTSKPELFNTEPFEIKLEQYHYITYEPYRDVMTNESKFYLHPSDHYGLSINLNFKQNLHVSSLSYTHTLAIVLPDHEAEVVQNIRSQYDAQYKRWPPHINILYPFFDLSNGSCDEDTVINDLLDTLGQFKSFECTLNEIKAFKRVLYLEPDLDSVNNIQEIYKVLTKTLFKHVTNKWKPDINPHCTIAQTKEPNQNFLKNTLKSIEQKFKNRPFAKFTIESIYWLQRVNDEPFKVKFKLPFGLRYPCTIIGLNPIELTPKERNLLAFLSAKKMILSEREDQGISKLYFEVLEQISSLSSTFVSNRNLNFSVHYFGSFLLGTKCSDFDFCLIHSNASDDFVTHLASELAKKTQHFHIVRNVHSVVPIVELQLTNTQISSADLQINKLLKCSDISTKSRNSYSKQMKDLEKFMEYKDLYAISGLFENQNIKRYIENYKDYQILLTFIKHWAKSQQIYGKAFGYIGSISWSIMAAFFLKKTSASPNDTISTNSERFEAITKSFFKFFANYSWNEAVSLVNIDHVVKTTGKYQAKRPMLILQTVFPYHNTARNVRHQAKQVIVDQFKRAAEIIKHGKEFPSEELCNELLIKSFPCYLKFTFELKDSAYVEHIFTLVKAKAMGLVSSIEHFFTGEIRPFCNLEPLVKSDGLFEYSTSYYIGLKATSKLARKDFDSPASDFILGIKGLCHTSEINIKFETNFE